MLPKVANHLFLHTSRAVALVQNQSGALRNVLQSGPAGAGSSWGSAGTGAGPGGAKFHAGSKFYKGYTGAGRTITHANSSATQDGPSKADDDKDEIKATFVTPRSSRTSRTLARRHSFSFPDHDHIGAGVLHSVQLQLRERHTAATENKDSPTDVTPEHEPRSVNAWSPFALALEDALSRKDTPAILKHVRWLIDPSQEPSLSYPEPTLLDFNHALRTLVAVGSASSVALISLLYNALLQRGLSPNLGTFVNTITGLTDRDREVQKSLDVLSYRAKRRQLAVIGDLDDAATEEAHVDEKHRATLLAEDNFATAMRVFDSACVPVPQSTSDSATAAKPLTTYFPIGVYHALLRSCAAHANIDAAIRVYAQLEARPQPPPTDLMFYYLLSTYVNAGDLTGAKEVFKEFRDLGQRGLVMEVGRQFPIQLRIWNKMIQGYFKVGQPAGALRLLETMMDSGKPEKGDLASVPSPASSTFTTIISGFCNPSSSDATPNPPRPDIKTALSWFDRLLQQPAASSHNDEPTQNPSRPDQVCWSVILDALVEASSEQTAYLKDLNRLYDALVDCAPKDRLGVKVSDTLMVLEANYRVLDAFVKSPRSEAAAEEAKDTANFVGKHLRRVTDQLSSVKPGRNLAKYKATVTKLLSAYFDTVAVVYSSDRACEQMMPLTPPVAWLGSPTPPSIARPLLDIYVSAPQVPASVSHLETLVMSALSLPVQSVVSDVSSPMGPSYTGLMPLLQAMSDVGVDFRLVSSKVQVALTEALYANYSEREVSQFLDGLAWSFNRLRMPLAERTNEGSDAPRIPTPPLPSSEFPPPPTQIIVDAELSRRIDQWFPSHPSITVDDSYNILQAAISGTLPRYPHPATLGRLINGLGRTGNIAAAQSVYSIAQQVLFSPFVAQSPTWQSQAWFQIEDSMIIAYAHGGDMDAAYGHRSRITTAGGVPSPDAYGSLIECVKDTTDDTSNAMALFAECQMLGTKPNVYLYNTIISKLAKARKADFALELFQQMKANTTLRPSSITYGAVIAACARVGDATAAEQLFEEMASQPNFRPRIPPYNTMMQLYTHTKPDREKVLFYLNKMKEINVHPSAHTYKLLIDAYGTIEPVDVPAMEATFKSVESNPHVRLQGSHWAALINAYGCVMKDTDKAIHIFESIASHTSSQRGPTTLPDAVTYESLINVLVTRKRMDLAQRYLSRLHASGVHMTAYIANLLIKGYAADGHIEQARAVFESLADPPSGVAAPGNHVPHESSASCSTTQVRSPGSVSYREPSTWEAMFRAELGNGDRDRAVAVLERLKQRHFPEAVYNRIRGIMLDDAVAPWGQSPSSQPESPATSSSP